MLFTLENGHSLRGDLVKKAVLRNDLSPIPVSLELEVCALDDELSKALSQGKTLKTLDGDKLTVVQAVKVAQNTSQAERQAGGIRITALLNSCLGIGNVLKRATVKENVSLSVIYRSCGALIRGIEADFPVPRFYCFAGDTPSFQIARILQEEGGVVRWKNSKLHFLRLADIFRQKSALTLPTSQSSSEQSEFLEVHAVPSFFSVSENARLVWGNTNQPRTARFSPFKNEQKLRNMTRCLVRKRVLNINLNMKICAGDLIEFTDGEKLAVITCAHVWKSGTDSDSKPQSYTRLWLGALKE